MFNLTLPDAFLAGFGAGVCMMLVLIGLYRAIVGDAERGM